MTIDAKKMIDLIDKLVEEVCESTGKGVELVVKEMMKRAKESEDYWLVDIMESYLTDKKRKAQIEYCKKTEVPRFAPLKGHCFSCGRQIYDRIKYEKAANTLITSCPFCHVSYCD